MATHGHLSEYTSAEDWASYTERMDQYFLANDVSDGAKKRAILLSVVGNKTYTLIRDLVAPNMPTDKTYQELVDLLTAHLEPKPSVIVERFKFNSRFRKEGETAAQFLAELRNLARHCDYGRNLDDMLRDRLVCGINDGKIQRRLLAEKELTLKRTWEIIQAMESADKYADDLQQDVHVKSVNAIQSQKTDKFCYRCGGKHQATACPFKEAECYACRKKGHIAKVCRSKPKVTHQQGMRHKSENTHKVDMQEPDATEYRLFTVSSQTSAPLMIKLIVNGQPLQMELDTGASVSLISEQEYNQWCDAPALEKSPVILRTYTGENLSILGTITVIATYNSQTNTLPLLVVKGEGPNLMGRDWLAKFRVDWQGIHQLQSSNKVDDLLTKFQNIFKDELGTVKDVKAHIHLHPNSEPKFHKARTVPMALRQKVEEELDRLERAKIIEPVRYSKWAAPVVPVIKNDGSIRLCGDYRTTVNQAAKLDPYPLPKIEDLFASLAGGRVFSKLDLSHAYLQVMLDEESRDLVTVNTHKGLFRFNRLPFGVASAPAIFQRIIEGILKGIPGICIYLDDILITGKTEEEHLTNLEEVFRQLEAAGMRLKRNKCCFNMPEVTYLGHRIDKDGLHPTADKTKAILQAPAPKNTTELRAFLGLINYYGKFLPNLSMVLTPLHKLLRSNTRWSWKTEQSRAFEDAKNLLRSPRVLIHYDSSRPLVLSCDASPYGVGAVLSHVMEDNTERPIAFASRTLAKAETNYAHLEKEALAIIFGIQKFHNYLYGRKFIIHSDHKPLMYILNASKSIPTMASPRVIRWSLLLSAYSYELRYRPGNQQANADALSRLPLPDHPQIIPEPAETVLLMNELSHSPTSAIDIRTWTSKDPTLSQVLRATLRGWREGTPKDPELTPYYDRRHELSVVDGCILWGNRVVIPKPGREKVVETLHETHPGIVKMKSLARNYVWWPKMDKELELRVRSCKRCQSNQNNPPRAPLNPWKWPEEPWVRLHADYAGPFIGHMYLIIVDAHSKWLEILPTTAATSQATVRKMREVFATHGLPDEIVTDNGTHFTGTEFQRFMAQNGIRHIKVTPYHPSSNGLAERAVQVFKDAMKKLAATPVDVETKLTQFLFQYRITPHATTGIAPAELLMHRRPKSHLDLLHPSVASRVSEKQECQKRSHDAHAKLRCFQVDDLVLVRNTGKGPKWIEGTVEKQTGPLSFVVSLSDGRTVRKHTDQLRARLEGDHPPANVGPVTPIIADQQEVFDEIPSMPEEVVPMPPTPRRSSRHRRPPVRFS